MSGPVPDRNADVAPGTATLNLDRHTNNFPDSANDPVMPESLAAIANEMARTYIINDHWFRVPETWWHGVSDLGVAAGGPKDTDDG